MTKLEINECPWCGYAADISYSVIGSPDEYICTGDVVTCINKDCRASGPIKDSTLEAIRAWNMIILRGEKRINVQL